MISLHSVTKEVYQGSKSVSILQSINLQIDRGEMVSIMGPSGSGKSTLLNIIGLLDEPTFGEYFFSGMDMSELEGKRLAKFRNEKIGFVFQSFMLVPRLSVEDNVEIPLLYSTKRIKDRKAKIREVLEQVGLIDKIKEPINRLSGGQKQKVAFARAMVNDPDILLADEPTGNLDQQSKKELLQIFQQVNREGKTIIIVTHDQEVAGITKRRLIIKDGYFVEKQ